MRKHSVIITVLVILVSTHTAPAKHMNVLFVAIDDLNDWVGCFGGNPQVKTPHLDRLNAEGGLVMTNAHAPATVCCPSRSALLTGVHAHKTEWNHPTLTNGCSREFYRVYDGRYSYISHRQRGVEELYDHGKDPMEWTNLAHDPEYASVKSRLQTYLPATVEPESPRN